MAAELSKGQGRVDKTLAGVCGLYCKACTLYIASTEEPERLKKLAAQLQLSEEAITCYGCRSDKRWPYCEKCKMSACAAEKGIDFCVACEEYPCNDLKEFQAARPHRIELWDDLERIRTMGYEQWMREVQKRYTCPRCQTVNSAYDITCRKCGEDPGCEYAGKHRKAVERYLAGR